MKWFFEAYVRTVDDPFEIEVENSDTVLQIKEKIHNSHGVPISYQTLIFEGNILHDEVTVQTSGVEDQSRIRLVVDVTEDDTDEDAAALPTKKMKRTEAAGSSSNTIPIQLKLPIMQLTVNADETVLGLKRRITELFETSGGRLVLRNEEGIDLADDKTLSECQITSESVVTVEIAPKMRVCLKIPGSDELVAVDIYGEDTILQLKEIINGAEGVPVDRIVVKDGEGNELPDDKTLTDCGIMPDAELAVEYLPPQQVP